VTSYLIAMLTLVAIYGTMALGLNVMWGLAGMVNFGVAGFFAIGAYTAALVETRLGWPIAAGMLAGTASTALVAGLACLGLRRLRDDYFSIVTLGIAEVVRIIADNEIWLTNGSDGISNIPQPLRAVFGANTNLFYLCFCVVLMGVSYAVAERARASPFGRVLRALRDDPQVAAVAGKSVVWFQVRAFALGGAMVGLAGALYGHFTRYVTPDIFVPLLTIYIFLAVTLGGKGSNTGTLLGTFIVVFVLESTRFITELIPGISPVQAASGRGMLIGACFVAILQLRPWGIVREPVLRLRRTPDVQAARVPVQSRGATDT
jgi:branched-chain amino acid transport system permease protein